MIEEWTAPELADRLDSGNAPVMVDVREAYELPSGQIAGSIHIPLGQLTERFGEIPAGDELVFICAGGVRSMTACRIAAAQGRSAINLAGGMSAWARR